MSQENSVKTVADQALTQTSGAAGKSAYHRPVLRDCGTLQDVTMFTGNGGLDDSGGYYGTPYYASGVSPQ